MAFGAEHAPAFLAANTDLQLHHMNDPNQDRLMLHGMACFRVKRLRLGFMKLLVDPHTGRLLGAGMLGFRCDEVVHAIAYLRYARVTHRAVMRAVPIHPCVAELIPTMLKQIEPLD